MSTVHYRPDYARFVFHVPGELWHTYTERLHAESHNCKYHGEWLKSHKINRLYFDVSSGTETWAIDIWGEWTGIVHRLPAEWLLSLSRFDARAIVWDTTGETIVNIGQHLQKHVTSHNVNVYSTREATKRLGRDRGGKGFAIGSHKSDLRITVYKRKSEPCALEFQMRDAYLRRLVTSVINTAAGSKGTIDPWVHLTDLIALHGNGRLDKVLKGAECDQFWSIIGSFSPPILPAKQYEFIPVVSDTYVDDLHARWEHDEHGEAA